MARVDDYINAKKLAVEELSGKSPEDIASRTGFEIVLENCLSIPFLNRIYNVSFPEFDFEDVEDAEKEVPIQEQVLILHYMLGKKISISDQWVAYREIPGASFYFSAFAKRAIDPLKNVFGNNTSAFKKAAEILNGKVIEAGDAGFEYKLFPNVPIQLILYEADDEFPSEANILFDKTIKDVLTPEDIAWLAGMLVYKHMALSR